MRSSPAAKIRSVRVWNVHGYQEVRVLHATVFSGHDDAVLSARFSRDGRQIVTASRDRTASLWDAATGEPLRQFRRRSRVPGVRCRRSSGSGGQSSDTSGHRRRRQLGAHLGRDGRHAVDGALRRPAASARGRFAGWQMARDRRARKRRLKLWSRDS